MPTQRLAILTEQRARLIATAATQRQQLSGCLQAMQADLHLAAPPDIVGWLVHRYPPLRWLRALWRLLPQHHQTHLQQAWRLWELWRLWRLRVVLQPSNITPIETKPR